jgi:polysaccharide biosynthesis protein PslG
MMAGRKARAAAAIALAAISVGLGSAGTATAQTPRDFFGVIPSGGDPDAQMQRMAQAGIGAVRVLVNWNDVEPRQGVRNWSVYDNYFGRLAAAHLQVQPLLLGEPSWIPRFPRPPIFGSFAQSNWQSFLTELAARYGRNGVFWQQHPELPYLPLVDWELWNEPNLSGYWGGKPSPRQYVRFLRVTGAGLRAADPQARIGIGGIFPPPRAHYGITLQAFLNGIYRIPGASSAFDAVAIHPYATRPKGVLAATRQTRAIMNRHHDRATPIWITEFGWSTGGLRWRTSFFRAKEPAQAKFLSRTYRLLIANRARLGIERAVWHAWQDGPADTPWTLHMGLIHYDESAKPSLAAYARLPK